MEIRVTSIAYTHMFSKNERVIVGLRPIFQFSLELDRALSLTDIKSSVNVGTDIYCQ